MKWRSMVNGRLVSVPVAASLLRDRLPGRGGVRVDDALALAADVALVGGHLRYLDRARAEGRARRRPAVVGLAFEVLEDDVRPWLGWALAGASCALHSRNSKPSAAHEAVAAQRHPAPGRCAGRRRSPASRPARPRFPRCRSFLTVNSHHRGRQRRVVGVQRDERREGLQRTLTGAVRVAVLDVADRILAAEGDVAPVGAVERRIPGSSRRR